MTAESSANSTIDRPSSPGEPTRPTPKHKFGGHKARIYSLVFLHDNVHIVSGSLDGTIRKWDCETGYLIGEPWGGRGGGIHALALSPDGKTIACGNGDGSVEMWNTDGEIIEGIWMGHSRIVRSLSWSPSGSQIASGFNDGTIVIPKAENGEVEVGPIQTKQKIVISVAYSPLGDRIASGANDNSIRIWDSNTGELLVSPTENLGFAVSSVVWSSDGSKLYSADKFVRVFDSISGVELHRFEDIHYPTSIALLPKYCSLLACVGTGGIAQLRDTETHQQDHEYLWNVSFSPDGRYLAYGGEDRTITLWMVKDIAPDIETPSSSCYEVDATRPFTRTEDDCNNIYDDFFQSSGPSHPSAAYESSRPPERLHTFSPRRLWNLFISSEHRKPAIKSVELQERPKRGFFARRTVSQPVTVYAGRPRKFYWRAPRRVQHVGEDQSPEEDNSSPDTQACQLSSAVQSSPAVQTHSQPQRPSQPHSKPQGLQQPQTQPTEEFDYGPWGNFCPAIWCIPRRPRRTAQPVAP